MACIPKSKVLVLASLVLPPGTSGTPNRQKSWITSREPRSFAGQTISARSYFSITMIFTISANVVNWRAFALPIIAGIMPIAARWQGTWRSCTRRSLSLRSCFVLWNALQRILRQLAGGCALGNGQCRDLLDNQVRGINTYVEQSDATRQIYQSLGLQDSILRRAARRMATLEANSTAIGLKPKFDRQVPVGWSVNGK